MKLHTYINEILDIAKAEHMSMDVAVNMFLANVKNAGDSSLPHYKGADHVAEGDLDVRATLAEAAEE